MASVLNEKRDPEWKKTWIGNTLLSAPPLPLLAIVGIVVFLLWISSYLNYKYSAMQLATTNVNLFLLFLPLVLTLIAQSARFMVAAPNVAHSRDGDVESESESSVPWGLVTFVLLLLVLISYRLHPIFVTALVFLYVYLFSA